MLPSFVPPKGKSYNRVEMLFTGKLAKWVGKISNLKMEETHRTCDLNNQDNQDGNRPI